MKVFSSNVAALLMERLEILEEENHIGWRCIYLQLHDKHERFNETLRNNFINRAVVDILSRDEGYIFFCDDGDILILFEGALKPLLTRLSQHFGDLNPDQLRGQSEENLFSFFDLSKHWEGFAEVCRNKATKVILARERLSHTTHYRRVDKITA